MPSFCAAFSPLREENAFSHGTKLVLQKEIFTSEPVARSYLQPVTMKTKEFVEAFGLQEKLQERKNAIENGNFPVLAPRAAVIGRCAGLVLLTAIGVTLMVLAMTMPLGGLGIAFAILGPLLYIFGGTATLMLFSDGVGIGTVFENTSVSSLEHRIAANRSKMRKLLLENDKNMEQLEKIEEELQKKLATLQNEQEAKQKLGAQVAEETIQQQITALKQAIKELADLKDTYTRGQEQFLQAEPENQEVS